MIGPLASSVILPLYPLTIKELLVRRNPVDELSDQEIADALDILRGFVAKGSQRAH